MKLENKLTVFGVVLRANVNGVKDLASIFVRTTAQLDWIHKTTSKNYLYNCVSMLYLANKSAQLIAGYFWLTNAAAIGQSWNNLWK